MANKFTHLHVHTSYSVADSMIKSEGLAKKLMDLGMDTIAITDHGTMLNIVEVYSTLKKDKIKTILGCETYVAPRSNTDKDNGIDDANYHLVLLAENNEGYSNLIKIVSDASVNGMYRKPRTDAEHLKKWHNGIICLSACIAGEVQQRALEYGYDNAKQCALKYDSIFGRGNFFLELQDHGLPEQKLLNPMLIRMSKETGIPLVATNDCHYIDAEDYEAHDILMAIQAKTTIFSDKRKKYGSDQFYVKSADEMYSLFGDTPEGREALENTVKIGERCNVEIDFDTMKLPPYHTPKSFNGTNEEFLRQLTYEGLEQRYGEISEDLKKRADYELEVIKNLGFINYFLITWDFFRFCRDGTEDPDDAPRFDWEPILTGPGRGSGAGSIVLYALEITHIDPIKYDLLFERFLSPDRISMPKRYWAFSVNSITQRCA